MGGRAGGRQGCWPTGAPTSIKVEPAVGRPAAQHLRCRRRARPGLGPAVRARQPGQAQRRARPAVRRGSGGDGAACSSGPTSSSPTCRVAALTRLGLDPTAVRQRHPRADLRDHHRLRPRRARGRPARLRRRRVLGPLDAGVVRGPAGRPAATDPRRVRRPRDRHDAGRRDQRRAVRPPAHGTGAPRVDQPPAGGRCTAPGGTSASCCGSGELQSTRLRHESLTPLVNCYAAADGRRVLAARPGGRPPLARPRRRHRPAGPRRRRALRRRPPIG